MAGDIAWEDACHLLSKKEAAALATSQAFASLLPHLASGYNQVTAILVTDHQVLP